MTMKNACILAIGLMLLGGEAFSETTAQRISTKLGYWNVDSSHQRLRTISLREQKASVVFLVDDNLSNSLIEHGFWSDSIFVMKQVFFSEPHVSTLEIVGMVPATDIPGERRLRVVGEINIRRSDFNRLPRTGIMPWMVKDLEVGYFRKN
jgi:hypothetical protein